MNIAQIKQDIIRLFPPEWTSAVQSHLELVSSPAGGIDGCSGTKMVNAQNGYYVTFNTLLGRLETKGSISDIRIDIDDFPGLIYSTGQYFYTSMRDIISLPYLHSVLIKWNRNYNIGPYQISAISYEWSWHPDRRKKYICDLRHQDGLFVCKVGFMLVVS